MEEDHNWTILWKNHIRLKSLFEAVFIYFSISILMCLIACQWGSLIIPSLAHLSPQTKHDIIHQDESVGHDGLWPVQHHTTFNLVTPLIGHLSRDVVCSYWEIHTNNLKTMCFNVLWEKVVQYTVPHFHHKLCLGQFLTCRFGPREHEGTSAAAPHLLIAGVEVNTVDSKGPQVGDV